MRWILVTGGVHSGIGKGCLAASLGRLVARAGAAVEYRKLEPCLQGEIGRMANTHFGEVVTSAGGLAFDADVARAAFLIPGFRPTKDSDLSLGRAVARFLERAFRDREPAPRLGDVSSVYAEAIGQPADVLVAEVGGTAGETEHALVCSLLRRALGNPALHVHLTTEVVTFDGRVTTKPAQVSLDALAARPHLLVVRVASADSGPGLATLRRHCGQGVVVMPVSTDDVWPERGYYEALAPGSQAADLLEMRLGLRITPDPAFCREDQATAALRTVAVVHDGAGIEGYASLVSRLRGWSGGRIGLDLRSEPTNWAGLAGVVRVGECPPPAGVTVDGVPTLAVVPRERGLDPRSPDARPDWLGTLDEPAGEVFDFVQEVLRVPISAPIAAPSAPLAYSVPAFASRYLEASHGGRLRDHALLDPLVWRALPGPDLLQGARVLDIGCGDGRWAEKLLAAGVGEVVGVEPAAPMADGAEQRHLAGLRLVRARIEDASLEGEFDAALAYMSLDHVEHLEPVLRRCARHLRPFGRLVVATEHPIRTAPVSGPRWLDEGGGARSSVVRDYASSGWRTYRWFGRSESVFVYHRPLEAWVDGLRAAGLRLVAVREPSVPLARDGGNPRFWLVVAERPGRQRRIVAVDGPAGSGATTLGKALAARLGWLHVDVARVLRALVRCKALGVDLNSLTATLRGGEVRFLVDGLDISSDLADLEPTGAAGTIAPPAEAPAAAARLLTALLEQPSVLSGRATGRTLRDPLLRIWLDAPAEVRAARLATTVDGVIAKDASDRALGWLLEPDIDAVHLDAGSSSLDELVCRAAEAVPLEPRRPRHSDPSSTVP